MSSAQFKAPWSAEIRFITILASFGLLVLTASVVQAHPKGAAWNVPSLLFLALGPVVLISSALLTVRGYTLTPSELVVHRLLWGTALPLSGLKAARADSVGMRWSLRLFGNGGFFGYLGFFASRSFGRYRAYATDRSRAVVLELPSRKIVVTPENPEDFLVQLQALFPTVDREPSRRSYE